MTPNRGGRDYMQVMTPATDPVLEALRVATASPSWAQRGFTTERNHTHVLVAALNSKKPESRNLAAALWNMASVEQRSGAEVTAEQITEIVATPEYALKQGKHSVVDLLVTFKVDGVAHQLAVEVKVDSKPYSAQLASMNEALGSDPHRRLVLLSLGAAQASRVEPDESTPPKVRRWYVADMLGLGELIKAASSLPVDAVAWLEELQREEYRRQRAWADDTTTEGCGYRGREKIAYSYWEVARLLEPSGACWEVSLQTHGVVLHGKSSHHEVPNTSVTLYLEVADGVLRVKAGAWYDASDARAAAEPLIPLIVQTMTAHGFDVKLSKRVSGSSVTLLSIDPDAAMGPLETVVDRLRRVHGAWKAIKWPA